MKKNSKKWLHKDFNDLISIQPISNCSYEDCLDNNEEIIWIKKAKKLILPLDLSFKNLKNVPLPSNLTKYNLDGANLSGQSFNRVKLPEKIKHANLNGVDFRKCKISTIINLSFSNLKNAKLPLNLSNFILTGCDLSGQDLSKHILPSKISNASLRNAKLPLDLRKVNLKGCNLSNVDLSKSLLPVDLSYTILEGTSLPEDIDYIKFEGVRI